MDDDNDLAINQSEFLKAMKDYGVGLQEQEYLLLFNEIDASNDGTLSIDELIRAIIGEMNEFR